MEEDDRYLTVREAATIARVHESTIREWISEGRLKATKPGKEYRIKRAWLDELMERHETPE